jgi:hypothetical protein
MDYAGILKRAWNVTWNHKILWLFGLFAGASAGVSGNSFNSSSFNNTSSATSAQSAQAAVQSALASIQPYWSLIIAAAVALFVIGFVLFVLAVAARGGLIYLTDQADEAREVRGGPGWRAGFSKWWRIFGVELLAALPVLAIVVVMLVALGLVVAAAAGGSQNSILGAIAGLCGVMLVLTVALIVVGTIFGIVRQLALNYAVLDDRHVIDSLKQGWRDLWAKRGAFLMFLMMTGVGIVVGIVLGLVALVLALPAGVAFLARQWVAGGVLLAVALLLLLVPGAIWSAFFQSAWTIFFRRMNGREAAPSVVAPGSTPMPSVPSVPPAPELPTSPLPEPTAPPVSPAPPVPPATGY